MRWETFCKASEDDGERGDVIVEERPCEGVRVSYALANWRINSRRPCHMVWIEGGFLDCHQQFLHTEDAARLAVVRWCAAAIHAQQAERILAEAKAMGEGGPARQSGEGDV